MSMSPTTTMPTIHAGDDVASRIAALRHRADGDVLVPGDDGYDEAALAWDRAVAHRPAVIVVADNVGDVIATVRFAADHLEVSLRAENTGHQPFTIEEALHTYLAVSDVRQVSIDGLDGAEYLDKVAGDTGFDNTQSGPVTLTGSTDRVYLHGSDEVNLDDPGFDRMVGLGVIMAGFVIGMRLRVDSHWLLPTLLLVSTGIGQGFFNTSNQTAVIASVPREHRGFATGIVQMAFGLGSLLGISLGGALLTVLFRHYSGSPDATPSAAARRCWVSATAERARRRASSATGSPSRSRTPRRP